MAQETLPHGIDWGKLEFRYNDSARTLAAFWGEFCITSVTAETLEERQHLLARLKKGVRRQHWNDAARPAGARASRDFDEMFNDVATTWPRIASGPHADIRIF
jgi:hypothetical protein